MEKGRAVYDESTRVQDQLGELQRAGQNTQDKATKVAAELKDSISMFKVE